MTDYSRADNSKNHKNSFMKMAQSILKEIEKLMNKFDTIWNKLEIDRKELASSIEDSIRILKELKIKTEKSLNHYSRDEVPGILLKISKTLSEKHILLKDQLIENAKNIESRFKFIKTKSQELSNLENKLSAYYVKEDDYEDEISINLADFRNKPKEEIKTEEEKQTITQDLSDLVKTTFRIVDDEEETDFDRVIVEKDYSLEDISLLYYGKREYWTSIYNFGENKTLIDQLCNLYNIELDDLVTSKNYLKGYEICLPSEITVKESIPNYMSKAA